MPNQPSREDELFRAALQLTSPEERAAYLKGATTGDTTLLQRVLARLRAHEQAGNLPNAATLQERIEARLQAYEQASDVPDPGASTVVPLTARPGDLIGRYKLLQRINEGGMGVVYMAEQE